MNLDMRHCHWDSPNRHSFDSIRLSSRLSPLKARWWRKPHGEANTAWHKHESTVEPIGPWYGPLVWNPYKPSTNHLQDRGPYVRSLYKKLRAHTGRLSFCSSELCQLELSSWATYTTPAPQGCSLNKLL